MNFFRLLGIGAAACALLAGGSAGAEDSVGGVLAVPAAAEADSGSRGELFGEINQIRQESRSQRDITNLRIEQMEREMERSTGYVQNLLIAFLIAGGIVVFLVLNTIRHQSRVNIYRMRQLIRDSERALAEIERHVQRPEYDHFQTARRLDRVMNQAREHERSLPQKMISDIYAAADDPTLPVSLHYQANALKCEQGSDWRQAISFWERLHQMDDSNPEVLLHLASCYKGLAEGTPGPEASVYRDTSLRFFQLYTQRNRNLQQLQANISAPPAPPAVSAPAPVRPQPPAVSAPPSPARPSPPPAPPPAVPAAASGSGPGLGQAAGRAVRSQVSMVGESASKLGSSFKRVGANVASGLYDRIKSVPLPSADGKDGRQEEEEPTYVPERKKIEMPPINYYREESAAKPAAAEKSEPKPAAAAPPAPASLKLAAAAATVPPPPPIQPAEEEEAPAVERKPEQVFAAPTIKPAAKSKPAAAAARTGKAGAGDRGSAKANGSARKPARKSAAARKKTAKVNNAASRFSENMQAAEQALKRAAAGTADERGRHLQEAISHYEEAVKYSSSLSMYRLWGNALLEQARLVPEAQAEELLAGAAEKFRQGEKIKPGAMSADLALACALAGKEDECRQAVGHCLKNGHADLQGYFEQDAFDRYRSADWFVSAQKKISA